MFVFYCLSCYLTSLMNMYALLFELCINSFTTLNVELQACLNTVYNREIINVLCIQQIGNKKRVKILPIGPK